MQLFLIERPIDASCITLTDCWILHQIGRVLRMKAGDEVSLQWEDTWQTTRWLYTILQLWKKSIELELIWELQTRQTLSHKITLAVALPNKRSKAELIVQKLAEIGVTEIVRFVAQRSQYDSVPDKKLQRMNDIAKEATEQSRGWKLMKVTVGWLMEEICARNSKNSFLVCDIHDEVNPIVSRELFDEVKSEYMIFVWPEWWRWPKDYECLHRYGYIVMALWTSVLRMETAAIIAAWRGVNESSNN